MITIGNRLRALGVAIPDILLPVPTVDLYRWAVIACDQHTSDPAYWHRAGQIVGNAPSTLHTIFPEVHLNEPDSNDRIKRIRNTMQSYLDDGVLTAHQSTTVYLERLTGGEHPRRGLMLAFDLERYDFSATSSSLIRATEDTIVERLPPRVRIRAGAPLELPHIMILIDDPEDRVFGRLQARAPQLPVLYDTELMLGGGRVSGYAVTSPGDFEQLASELERLGDPQRTRARYNSESPLLFAMGDGNHSFATAKQVWEEHKRRDPAQAENPQNPARYALAELVNLHDPALEFEPIHRMVFHADAGSLLEAAASSPEFELERNTTRRHTDSLPPADRIILYADGQYHTLRLAGGGNTLAVAVLQRFIDDYLRSSSGAEVDYIHGVAEVIRVADEQQAVGFLLPEFDKGALFSTVVRSGPLPRKCFSLGEAHEKRYYLEARRIL